MAVSKPRLPPKPDERMRRFAVERAKPPKSDPTGKHHEACRQIADEVGRDVGDVLEFWGERAAIRTYDAGMSLDEAEAAAVEDCRQHFVRR